MRESQAIYPHLLSALVGRPWAIHEPTMNVILEIMGMRSAGMRFTEAEINERLAAAAKANGPRAGGGRTRNVAVLPIYGVITPRAGLMAQSSGGTSVESIRQDFRAALADDDIDAIAFDVDSPGGVVDGLPELFTEIFEARGTKPMTAVANTMMASGALWLSAGADKIVASPSATVGSIGVIGVHQDKSEKYAKEGIKHTIIKTSPFKGEGSDTEPLSDDAYESMLSDAMVYDDMFSEAMGLGRGVSVQTVRNDFGQGRAMVAKRALDAGLIDGVQTLEQAVQDLAVGAAAPTPAPMAAFYQTTANVDLVVEDGEVVSTAVQRDGLATALPFAARLALVTEELEAVVGIARDRATRRAGERPLSKHTEEHLERIRAALDGLATAEPEAQPVVANKVASVQSLDLMLRLYQEGQA